MDSLQNHLLIAMPHLSDETFGKSVIYLCDHSEDGSMGLLVNKPIESARVASIIQSLGLDTEEIPRAITDVYYGGPVQPGLGFVLHSSDYGEFSSNALSPELFLSTQLDVLEDIREGKGPEKFRFTLGYAGWGEGQLEREIANGDWLVIPASAEFIFDKPDTAKWSESTKRFGIEISDIGGIGGIA